MPGSFALDPRNIHERGNRMNVILICAVILLVCAVSSKVLYRFGIPTLILFLTIGMLMGSEGPGGIYFDNAQLAENICNLALLIIIFSGGFDTNWKTARPVAFASGVLASIGVVLTALLVGAFAHHVLGFTLLEGLLLGSIISPEGFSSSAQSGQRASTVRIPSSSPSLPS
jgi:cell volume regulation protein A